MNLFEELGLDRRKYTRCPVTVDGEIFLEEQSLPIVIKNISEAGIGFEVDKEVFRAAQFRLNEIICIQFVDNYNWDADEYADTVIVKLKIVRIVENNTSFFIGGSVICIDTENDYFRYVNDKKIAHILTITANNRKVLSSIRAY